MGKEAVAEAVGCVEGTLDIVVVGAPFGIAAGMPAPDCCWEWPFVMFLPLEPLETAVGWNKGWSATPAYSSSCCRIWVLTCKANTFWFGRSRS